MCSECTLAFSDYVFTLALGLSLALCDFPLRIEDSHLCISSITHRTFFIGLTLQQK